MKFLLPIALGLLGLAAASLPAAAQTGAAAPPPPANKCFFITEFNGWRAPDNRTINIRVGMNRYYRLDLTADCPMLTFPGSHLVTKTRGPDTVCSALDWDLSVAQSPPNSFPVPCIVKAMTLLSPTEVAAIPPKFKP
jgi:hypothetical protein